MKVMRTFVFVLLAALLLQQPRAQALHIMIDPGHGGVDQGAVHHQLKEAEIVLDIAKRLHLLLQKEPGLRVSLTRHTNKAIPLDERTRLAEDAKADLLISLHANSAPDPRARGVELFFQNSLPPDEDALYLANIENQDLRSETEAEVSHAGDVHAIVHDLQRQNRLKASLRLSQTMAKVWPEDGLRRHGPSIKQAPLRVVSQSTMPSVLVEVGFLTNPQEAQKLAHSDYREGLARTIQKALLVYRDKIRPPIQNETVSK